MTTFATDPQLRVAETQAPRVAYTKANPILPMLFHILVAFLEVEHADGNCILVIRGLVSFM